MKQLKTRLEGPSRKLWVNIFRAVENTAWNDVRQDVYSNLSLGQPLFLTGRENHFDQAIYGQVKREVE